MPSERRRSKGRRGGHGHEEQQRRNAERGEKKKERRVWPCRGRGPFGPLDAEARDALARRIVVADATSGRLRRRLPPHGFFPLHDLRLRPGAFLPHDPRLHLLRGGAGGARAGHARRTHDGRPDDRGPVHRHRTLDGGPRGRGRLRPRGGPRRPRGGLRSGRRAARGRIGSGLGLGRRGLRRRRSRSRVGILCERSARRCGESERHDRGYEYSVNHMLPLGPSSIVERTRTRSNHVWPRVVSPPPG